LLLWHLQNPKREREPSSTPASIESSPELEDYVSDDNKKKLYYISYILTLSRYKEREMQENQMLLKL
jgi:hypothetical protein